MDFTAQWPRESQGKVSSHIYASLFHEQQQKVRHPLQTNIRPMESWISRNTESLRHDYSSLHSTSAFERSRRGHNFFSPSLQSPSNQRSSLDKILPPYWRGSLSTVVEGKVAAIDWRETDWELLGEIHVQKEKERVGRGRMKYLFPLLMINLVLRYKAHIIFDRDDVGQNHSILS